MRIDVEAIKRQALLDGPIPHEGVERSARKRELAAEAWINRLTNLELLELIERAQSK